MAWSYKIDEINKPSLVSIRIQFTLRKDTENYVSDAVLINPSDLEGKTNAEKLTYIKAKISEKCQPYTFTYAIADGLEAYVGSEVNL